MTKFTFLDQTIPINNDFCNVAKKAQELPYRITVRTEDIKHKTSDNVIQEHIAAKDSVTKTTP